MVSMVIRRGPSHPQLVLAPRQGLRSQGLLQKSAFYPTASKFRPALETLYAGKTIRDQELALLNRLENWPRLFALAAQRAQMFGAGEDAEHTEESLDPSQIVKFDQPSALATWIWPHAFGLSPFLESLSLVSVQMTGVLADTRRFGAMHTAVFFKNGSSLLLHGQTHFILAKTPEDVREQLRYFQPYYDLSVEDQQNPYRPGKHYKGAKCELVTERRFGQRFPHAAVQVDMETHLLPDRRRFLNFFYCASHLGAFRPALHLFVSSKAAEESDFWAWVNANGLPLGSAVAS